MSGRSKQGCENFSNRGCDREIGEIAEVVVFFSGDEMRGFLPIKRDGHLVVCDDIVVFADRRKVGAFIGCAQREFPKALTA